MFHIIPAYTQYNMHVSLIWLCNEFHHYISQILKQDDVKKKSRLKTTFKTTLKKKNRRLLLKVCSSICIYMVHGWFYQLSDLINRRVVQWAIRKFKPWHHVVYIIYLFPRASPLLGKILPETVLLIWCNELWRGVSRLATSYGPFLCRQCCATLGVQASQRAKAKRPYDYMSISVLIHSCDKGFSLV